MRVGNRYSVMRVSSDVINVVLSKNSHVGHADFPYRIFPPFKDFQCCP